MLQIQLSTNPPNTYISGARLVVGENPQGEFNLLDGKDELIMTVQKEEITEIRVG